MEISGNPGPPGLANPEAVQLKGEWRALGLFITAFQQECLSVQ